MSGGNVWGSRGDSSRRDQRGPRHRRPQQGGNAWDKANNARSSDEAALVVPEPYQNGRHLAYAVLQEYDRSERFVQDIFAEYDQRHHLSSQDRALAVDVASGVVRRSRTLDVMLESRMTRPRHNVEPDLWRILRVGAYQLLFARTPEHAAVDSTVDLCRDLDRARWTGFVNGVLRNIGRLLSDEPCDGPSQRSLPTTNGRWRSLNEAVFADPATNPAQYFADAFSLPMFLASRWCGRFSSSELLTICFQSVSPPSTSLRVNGMRTSAAEVLTALTESGCKASPGQIDGSIHLDQSVRLENLPGYAEGLWSVQDEAAMSASLLLDPKPGETILDVCSAPGGKTTHLAELSQDQASITACDVATGRLQRVLDNADRLQLSSITPQLIGKDGNSLPDGPFDAVLVDVPCSNTGVLNRRPEARWRSDENALQELVLLQTRLLLQACERVRPGGRVVYSTCSLEPEENRGVVDTVLSVLKDFRVARDILHLPGQPADGAYQALLLRS
jgi:16S rRNA (cytosine967-C5)-methyltransferase